MEKVFYIVDGDKKIKCSILHQFKYNDSNYIIYSDNSLDSNNELQVLASKFIFKDNNIELIPLNDDEWDIVDKEWEKLNG